MNFFEHQEQARRQTRTLVILFVLAVIAIVAAVNLTLAVVWIWTQGADMPGSYGYPRGFFVFNTVATLLFIGGGTALEIWNLRDGGDAVAQMAGGRLVPPSTTDPRERRLINVVEEMSLASGIACPKVYVLDREESINAFAAGYNPNEAVVAVTRGTLLRLNRDELQGVVAHEFSHILNGDMRLNVRLIGVLFGIQMLSGFGRHLMEFGRHFSSGRSRNSKGPSAAAVMYATGAALWLIGYIGVFFGRLIKSAVSRQREFLADASAVQFTRNPDGIGGALRKIGGLSRSMTLGSKIDHPNAEQLSHLFLGPVKPNLLAGLFATHPPMTERLRRIYGRSVDLLDAPVEPDAHAPAQMLPDIPYVAAGLSGAAEAAGSAAAAAVAPAAGASRAMPAGPDVLPPIAFGHGGGVQQALPAELDAAVRDPYGACAVVHALLLGQGDERAAQVAILSEGASGQAALAVRLAERIATLPRSARLPLLDLAMPALRALAQRTRDDLLATANRLIAADRRVTLSEFVLQTVLERRLDAHAGRAVPVRFPSVDALGQDAAVLLSLAAHVAARGNGEDAAVAFERGRAAAGLALPGLVDAALIGFPRVRTALEAANRLAPLAKPFLIRALLATASRNEGELPVESADLLRAICAAIDSPVPEAVAATYTAHYWQVAA